MGSRFIAWARVSSAQQRDEGWSLEEQERRLRDYAAKVGGEIVRMFVVCETASKHEERKTFREMIAFAKKNAGRIDALLAMKIDRVARNLFDYVEVERLEQEHGIKLVSVTQPTDATPSGRMMRRTFANFAAFFTEQLAVDVKSAMKRRAEAGLFVGKAPFGYRNVRDSDGKRRIIDVCPDRSQKVKRIFSLYAHGGHTIDSLRDTLHAEGLTYTTARPRWRRKKIHEILTDRSYIGEVEHLGHWHQGTHEALIDRRTFDRVQDVLGRGTYRQHDLIYAGSIITCGHCGRPITGEAKIKNTKAGPKVYRYYRCSDYNSEGHPRVRLPEDIIDRQLLAAFDALRIEDDALRDWYADLVTAKTHGAVNAARDHREKLGAELKAIEGQKDCLLNMRLASELDAEAFSKKQSELRDREARVRGEIASVGQDASEQAAVALKAFELSQSLKQKWLGSDLVAKRRILEITCLNLRLDGTTLDVQMRKAFAVIGKRPILTESDPKGTRLEPFLRGVAELPPEIRVLLLAG